MHVKNNLQGGGLLLMSNNLLGNIVCKIDVSNPIQSLILLKAIRNIHHPQDTPRATCLPTRFTVGKLFLVSNKAEILLT
jgi:hypothetical protein